MTIQILFPDVIQSLISNKVKLFQLGYEHNNVITPGGKVKLML